jgi:hypothetical protein
MPNGLIKTISRRVYRDVQYSTNGTRKSLKKLFEENLENISNLEEFLIEDKELKEINKSIGSMESDDIFSALILHEEEYKILCGCIFCKYSFYDSTDNLDRPYIERLYYLEGKDNISNVEPLFLHIDQIKLFKKVNNRYKKFLGLPSDILEESIDQNED